MDCLVLSLPVRPSLCLKWWDPLYETVAVFSLPAFSGETILSAAFLLYKLQHVLAKEPPFPKYSISRKGKEFQYFLSKFIYLTYTSLSA